MEKTVLIINNTKLPTPNLSQFIHRAAKLSVIELNEPEELRKKYDIFFIVDTKTNLYGTGFAGINCNYKKFIKIPGTEIKAKNSIIIQIPKKRKKYVDVIDIGRIPLSHLNYTMLLFSVIAHEFKHLQQFYENKNNIRDYWKACYNEVEWYNLPWEKKAIAFSNKIFLSNKYRHMKFIQSMKKKIEGRI